MKYTFKALLKTEKDEAQKLQLLKKFLESNYVDGVVTELLLEEESWKNSLTDKIRINITENAFYRLTDKLMIIINKELGEKDRQFITNVLEKYLETGLKILQEDENAPEEKKIVFVKVIEKIEEKFTSPKLKDTFEKSKERFKKPLQLTMAEKEEPKEKLKIKSLSKLKQADIEFILKNKENYDEKDFEKLLKSQIKKEKEEYLLEKGIDILEILKIKVEMYKNKEVDTIEVKFRQNKYLEEKTKKQIMQVIDVFEEEDEKNQIQQWFDERNISKEEINNKYAKKEFDLLLKIINEKLKDIDNIEQLMYDNTIDYLGRSTGTIEEKINSPFYTYIDNDEYSELMKEKELEQREKGTILKRSKTEEYLFVTGKLLVKLDDLFELVLKNNGLKNAYDIEETNKYLNKIILLQINKKEKANHKKTQWELYTTFLGDAMLVVADYMNDNQYFLNQKKDKKKNSISKVVHLLSTKEESTVHWYSQFLNHYEIKIENDRDLKRYTEYRGYEKNYWFVKHFYPHILDEVVQLYGEQKDEEFLQNFVSNYLK